jgi:hypothetical protein
MRSRTTGQLSWQCVFFVDTAAEEAPERERRFPTARTLVLDAAPFAEEWQFTRAVWDVLRCEAYFGYSPPPGEGPNWNALNEGLMSVDEDTTPAKDYLLVVRNAAILWQRLPGTAGHFLQNWLWIAEWWATAQQTSFDLLFVL